MRKIAIALSKGGAGKTTTAVNLAACFASSGRRVLLVDTDTQAQAAKILGLKPSRGLADLLEGEEDCIKEAGENLQILAGSPALAQTKRLISRRDIRSEAVLSEAFEHFKGLYDFIILDTAPGWDELTVNVLFYATELLCPVSLEALSLDGFLSFLGALEPIRRYKEMEVDYILPTFYDRRVKKSEEILGQLQDHFGEKLCDPIRYSVRFSEAAGFGQTIFQYSPSDPGAGDYFRLAERILEPDPNTGQGDMFPRPLFDN